MSNNIVFLVEGEKLDVRLSKEIEQYFLVNKANLKIIPYKTNIYSLYTQLKSDDFDTDIISVLKEREAGNSFFDSVDSISEIYLFFDYDAHHYQTKKDCEKVTYEQLNEMLYFFDNETDQGKLYISYPMIEAIHHCSTESISKSIFIANYVNAFRSKHINNKSYKCISYFRSKLILTDDRHYKEKDWNYLLTNFLWGINYLFKNTDYVDYNQYRENFSPSGLFKKQYDTNVLPKKQVLVLSGYPQFILDYFGEEYYNNIVNNNKFFEDSQVVDYE